MIFGVTVCAYIFYFELILDSHKSCRNRDFPGGPVVRIPLLTAEGSDSVPDWGTKIPQAMQWKKVAKIVQRLFGSKKENTNTCCNLDEP